MAYTPRRYTSDEWDDQKKKKSKSSFLGKGYFLGPAPISSRFSLFHTFCGGDGVFHIANSQENHQWRPAIVPQSTATPCSSFHSCGNSIYLSKKICARIQPKEYVLSSHKNKIHVRYIHFPYY